MAGFSDIFGGGADVPAYQPFTGTSGLGSIDFEGDRAKVSLDPRYRDIVNQLLGGFQGVSPSLSPEQLALGTQATQRGGAFLEQLGADPFDIAEKQFARMEDILRPERERTRTATSDLLLSQGRLGSTGGGRTQEAQEAGFERSRRAGLAEAFGQAQGVQAQQAQLGQQLGAFGLSTEQQQLQRMLQSLGAAQATEAMPLQLAEYLANISGQRSRHQLGAAELEGGGGGFDDILGGALSSGLEAYTGGLGKKYGTQ